MDAAPVVTVLMPCKSAHVPYFRESVDSVFAQTSSQWNLIIIDDHTCDRATLELLNELANSSDGRLSVVSNSSNLITGALKTGMRHAVTIFVCQLHCDDLLDRRAVEFLDHYMQKYPQIDYFHSSRMCIDENGSPLSDVQEAIETFDLSDFVNFGPVKALHCWKVTSALAIGGIA